MGSVHGKAPFGAMVRLTRVDASTPSMNTPAEPAFNFQDVPEGWYIVSVSINGSREVVKSVHVGGKSVNVGTFSPRSVFARFTTELGPPSVVTVCEALQQRDRFDGSTLVVVGVFKSGMDETLRLDCPTELVSGDVGGPSSIGLTNVSQPPENLREQVEKKRQEILSSAPPEGPLRPERVVGLYGRFVALAGLTSAKCCSAAIETVFPPARLFGPGETDLRVIR